MARDLTGRCGTCSFFIELGSDDQGHYGECRLGCWPAPLRDHATCTNHKAIGASWSEGAWKKKAAKQRRQHTRTAPAKRIRPTIPETLDMTMDTNEFRTVLREVLLDELGIRDVDIAERWQDGELVLVPGKEGTQDKRIAIETFFHKIVMIRDKLRVLEQKINGNASLSDADKVQLQQYITGCYGTLTTFNVLFREREEGFVGASNKDG